MSPFFPVADWAASKNRDHILMGVVARIGEKLNASHQTYAGTAAFPFYCLEFGRTVNWKPNLIHLRITIFVCCSLKSEV